MPILLEPRDFMPDVENFKSVLIVSCPMCPPMNLAMQTETPFIELYKHGIKTPAYEEYIQSIRDSLEERGIRTDVFTTRLPTPLMCVWTEGQRKRLLKHAEGFDAALVMGCSSAVRTAEDALKEVDCPVFRGMRMKGIANAKLEITPPMTVNIKRTPSHKEGDFKPCEQPCEADLDAASETKTVGS
jgi:hypothetical protein